MVNDNISNVPQTENNTAGPSKLRLYMVVVVLGSLCALFIWYLFKPESSENDFEGLIEVLPDGATPLTYDNKSDAYEMELSLGRKEEKMQTLDELTAVFFDDHPEAAPKVKQSEIVNAHENYRAVQNKLQSFDFTEKINPETEALKKQVEQLNALLEERHNQPDPAQIMEMSYKMASQYMGQTSPEIPTPPDNSGNFEPV